MRFLKPRSDRHGRPHTPPILPPGLQSLRVLRLLRLLRLLKLAQVSRRVFSFQGLRYAALLAFLTIIAGGAAFSVAENDQDPPVDLWDGVWWATATMTTVGSNIQPDTTPGRIIALVLMVVGISFVALLTGAVAERFVGPEVKEEIAGIGVEADQAREEVEADLDQEQARLLAEVRKMAQRMSALEGEIQALMRRP